jgi:hypothetical protein
VDVNAGSDLKVPQFAEGYRAGGKKPKAGDYEPVVCVLLLYFSVPHRFRPESGNSAGFRRNGTGIRRNGTGMT